MSFFVWTEIVCAECAVTTGGEYTTGRVRRRNLRDAAEWAGWKLHERDWYCKKCWGKREKVQEGDF